ncbi:MAG TPA: hypothetical protein VKU00_30590, partial [Chthonomonadaceae bacterium]|nr:hypothetical protein [Chthonomonadaceae bacterium]
MLIPYTRRAFLLLALLALEPAAASASDAGSTTPTAPAAPRESLWDVLERTTSAVVPLQGSVPGAAAVVRRPLGPVPGYSLAVDDPNLPGFPEKAKRGSPLGPVGDWLGRLETMTGTKIKATGYSTLSFRKDDISGSDTSYQSEQYFGQGSNGVYTDTDVSIDATMFKYLHYQTHISNSLFKNPNDNTVKLDYNTKKVRIEFGNINAGFQGNSLIDFNRYLYGIRIHNEWTKQFNTTVLYSQTRAETRTFVTQGNGSPGPYYVYSGQIVDGSDHVRLNSQDLIKGTDYTLDPFSGQLMLLHNMIAGPTDTLAISYEALDYGNTPGTIMGGRTEYSPSPKMHFGLTYVAQTSQGSGIPGVNSEFYHGLPALTAYRTNDPIDISKPVNIYIDGQWLAQNQYTIDNTTAYTDTIYLKNFVPPTSTVNIQYYPYNPNPTPGNR